MDKIQMLLLQGFCLVWLKEPLLLEVGDDIFDFRGQKSLH